MFRCWCWSRFRCYVIRLLVSSALGQPILLIGGSSIVVIVIHVRLIGMALGKWGRWAVGDGIVGGRSPIHRVAIRGSLDGVSSNCSKSGQSVSDKSLHDKG